MWLDERTRELRVFTVERGNSKRCRKSRDRACLRPTKGGEIKRERELRENFPLRRWTRAHCHVSYKTRINPRSTRPRD